MAGGILPRGSATQSKIPTTALTVVGEVMLNSYDGSFWVRGNNGSDFVSQVGAVNRRQATWQAVGGLAASSDSEFDEQIFRFTQGAAQAITTWVRVPRTYIPGKQITLFIQAYTPGTGNVYRLSTTTSLVRAGTDAVTSTTNQNTPSVSDTTITSTANLLQTFSFTLTDSTGLVNSVAVSAGDMLKVVLSRVTPSGTDDANDVRVLPNSGEVQF